MVEILTRANSRTPEHHLINSSRRIFLKSTTCVFNHHVIDRSLEWCACGVQRSYVLRKGLAISIRLGWQLLAIRRATTIEALLLHILDLCKLRIWFPGFSHISLFCILMSVNASINGNR